MNVIEQKAYTMIQKHGYAKALDLATFKLDYLMSLDAPISHIKKRNAELNTLQNLIAEIQKQHLQGHAKLESSGS